MPGRPNPPRGPLSRDDLPAELSAQTLRDVPVETLLRFANPNNGVLTPAEQETLNRVLREVMSRTAGRVSGQLADADWARVRREAGRARQGGRRPTGARDRRFERISREVERQVDLAEQLAPGVDWSFAWGGDPRSAGVSPGTDTTVDTTIDATVDATPGTSVEVAGDQADDGKTLSDLEDDLTDQVELLQVMADLAEISRRTYELEQQRDLTTTRGMFFGFIVSLAVIVAGWAPIVEADWAERRAILWLTLGTCVAGALAYMGVRRWQTRHPTDPDPTS